MVPDLNHGHTRLLIKLAYELKYRHIHAAEAAPRPVSGSLAHNVYFIRSVHYVEQKVFLD